MAKVIIKSPERWAGSQETGTETPSKGPGAAGSGSEDGRGGCSGEEEEGCFSVKS